MQRQKDKDMRKKVLITGAKSYIGTNLENWLAKYPDIYIVETVDMLDDAWREKSFSGYDVILHVAGIAHIKETKKNKDLYYKVNRDLAYETACKAKNDHAGQFIFLSSMSIYGIETGIISEDTEPRPKSNYGKSKLEAEKLIRAIQSSDFNIVILRPPMIYGKGCRGNYPRLSRMIKRLPFFPDIMNKRSMLYIDNLCEHIRLLIDNGCSGTYMPQNSEYICTSEMAVMIMRTHGKDIRLVRSFNPLIKILKISLINKIFGDLVYDKNLSGLPCGSYDIVGFEDSIKISES
jgi:UDP-glucose 4-epimerase